MPWEHILIPTSDISQWISWFLSSKGNEYFCEVEEDYILDRFNLTGLNTEVQHYAQALDMITDNLGMFPMHSDRQRDSDTYPSRRGDPRRPPRQPRPASASALRPDSRTVDSDSARSRKNGTSFRSLLTLPYMRHYPICAFAHTTIYAPLHLIPMHPHPLTCTRSLPRR